MLQRTRPGGYLVVREDPAPAASVQLEEEGFVIVTVAKDLQPLKEFSLES